MRTFSEEQPLTYGLSIFEGHIEKDRHDNDVSKISFPDREYRMVHHSKNHHIRQFATIYFGKDKFIKFCSYWSDNDRQAHKVELITACGKLEVAWGDGDCLWVTFEAVPNAEDQNFINTELKERIEGHLKSIYFGPTAGKYEDDEVSVIMFAMAILTCDPDVCMTKNSWTEMREALKKQQAKG